MQIVVDIPEITLLNINSRGLFLCSREDFEKLEFAIKNGTSLPKGHGRLIDESEMSQKLDKYYYLNEMYTLKIIKETIEDKVPTVLEADRGDNR